VNTDELIAALAADAKPVQPLPAPGRRFSQWLTLAVLFVGVGILAFGFRDDLRVALADPRFIVVTALTAATALVAGIGALVLAVPGADRAPAGRILPIVVLAGWSVALLALLSGEGFEMAGSLAWPWTLCIAKVAVLGAPPAYVLLRMQRRAAPLRLSWAAGLAGLAALSMGALGVQFVCPNWHAGHQLLTHYAPVVIFSVALAVVGPRWIAWAPRV